MKIIEKPAIALPKMIIHRKVAAYCRVSTQQEIQHHSLEAQQTYYEKLIAANLGWVFVVIYADEASGRNTLQFLQSCDELKRLAVDVYFEVEKIYLHNSKAVRLLTIYASVCQNESEMKSANTCWGIRTRFANGTSAIANIPCYGYRRDGGEGLAPVAEEADVVRMIYDYRRLGMSLRKIARELSNRGISSPRGKPEWSIETIRRILQNEKYIGHVLLQKTYVSDYFTGKRSTNNGELPRYLIENHHEPILEK